MHNMTSRPEISGRDMLCTVSRDAPCHSRTAPGPRNSPRAGGAISGTPNMESAHGSSRGRVVRAELQVAGAARVRTAYAAAPAPPADLRRRARAARRAPTLRARRLPRAPPPHPRELGMQLPDPREDVVGGVLLLLAG